MVTRLALTAAVLIAAAGSAGAARFPVGVTNVTFTKTSVTTGQPRPLDTVIWYPAARRGGTAEALGLRDAKPRRGRFPLIVFTHGSCGLPTEATYLTMALAREGFVVAAPPHPGNTRNDPTCFLTPAFVDSIANRQPDVSFVIDSMLAEAQRTGSRFARRIDTETIAVTGLSAGGFTTLLTAIQDPRVDVALAMVIGGSAAFGPDAITVPTMLIGAERDPLFPESGLAYAKLAGPRFLVELLAANHLSVIDACDNGFAGLDLCVAEDISQEDAHRLVLRYALPFARRYLHGRRGAGRALVKQVDGVVLTSEPER